MFRRIRNKKGNTLAELCVVMAIIAIVSTMVVSFCALVGAQTVTISKKTSISDANSTAKEMFDLFVEKYDVSGNTFKINESIDNKYTSNHCKGLSVGDKYFCFDNSNADSEYSGTIYGTYFWSVKYITKISFVIKSGTNCKGLITMTVTYSNTKNEEESITYMKSVHYASVSEGGNT